jgi:hypothetical protein
MPKAAKAVWSKERYEQDRRAEIDAVIAEFGGATDAPATMMRMAQTLLDYRRALQQFADAGEMVRQGAPFAVIGPGRLWKPDPTKQFPRPRRINSTVR